MVLCHLHGSGLLYRITHVHPAFDGASGFVLLSGLVLGMVQRRRLNREGLPALQAKTARRLGLLYLAQVGLGTLALLVSPPFRVYAAADPAVAVLGVLTLQVAPSVGNILRMYVVFFILALVAYRLLAARRTVALLSASLALYVGGAYLAPAYTTFSSGPTQAEAFSWAGWQLLFFSALVLGWHWQRLDVAGFLELRRWPVLAAALGGLVVSRIAYPYLPELFAKDKFAPGRILVAYLGVAFLIVSVDLLLARVPHQIFRPLTALGQRSLDSYLWQAVAGVVLVSGAGVPRSAALALGTLAACWAWAELRRVWDGRAQRAVAAHPAH